MYKHLVIVGGGFAGTMTAQLPEAVTEAPKIAEAAGR